MPQRPGRQRQNEPLLASLSLNACVSSETSFIPMFSTDMTAEPSRRKCVQERNRAREKHPYPSHDRVERSESESSMAVERWSTLAHCDPVRSRFGIFVVEQRAIDACKFPLKEECLNFH